MKQVHVIAALALVAVLAASGCTTTGDGNGTVNGTIVLDDGVVVPANVCAQRGVADTVVVFHSEECPACRQALPILQEIEGETGKKFEYIEVRSDEGRQRMAQLGMAPSYIPTVLIKCQAYVGYRDKAAFMALIGN
jgi:thiol-disulfide isomerase/thioredoxin